MKRGLLGAGLLAALVLAVVAVQAALEAASYPVSDLATRVPRVTALMRERGATAPVDQRWIAYESVSPLLRRAVLVAEDDAFFTHGGLDWNEIQASARRNLEAGRIVRGGSTITQQLARNLFLGDARTLTRKLKEVFLALRLERALSKRRIFELYLNLIEWGDGIYGIEAAARRYFGVPASDLSPREAVLLAAVIINPRRFSPVAPPARIEHRVRIIAGRLRRRGFLDDQAYASAIGEPLASPARAAFPGGMAAPAGGAAADSVPPPAPAESAAAAPAESLAPGPGP